MMDPRSEEAQYLIALADAEALDNASYQVGGEAKRDAVIAWADRNLSPGEAANYNQRLNDPSTAAEAIGELQYRHGLATGSITPPPEPEQLR